MKYNDLDELHMINQLKDDLFTQNSEFMPMPNTHKYNTLYDTPNNTQQISQPLPLEHYSPPLISTRKCF
jgi:hypothetical protein